MTERQESLHDEILVISEALQLGIRYNDLDWFWVFTQRMQDVKDGWGRVATKPNLSIDFILEFKDRVMPKNWLYNDSISLDFVLPCLDLNSMSSYLTHSGFPYVYKIAKDEGLKDQFVLEHERLFDQTFGNLSGNARGRTEENEKTAWYYVLRNSSISAVIKDQYKNKPQYNRHAAEFVDKEDDIKINTTRTSSSKWDKLFGFIKQRK